MKLLLLSATLLAATAATAQMNRVSLNVHSISGTKSFAESPDNMRSTNSALDLLPTIGYYRLIGKTTGIGLELGYNRNKSLYEQRYASSPTQSTYTSQEMMAEEFFVSPGIFEVITSTNKRYRLIPYLNLPIGFTPKSTVMTRTVTRESNGSFVSDGVSEAAPRQQLRIGLQAGASAQIRVAGGFYAGISLGAGVTYYRQKVSGEYFSVYTQNGQSPVRTSTTIIDNLSQTFGLGIEPQINFSYFF